MSMSGEQMAATAAGLGAIPERLGAAVDEPELENETDRQREESDDADDGAAGA